MGRRWLATLACVAFSGLSCSIFAPDPGPLPSVSAGPPGTVDTAAVREAEVAGIAAAMSLRPTGLTAGEIHAVARTVVAEARRQALEPTLVLAVMQDRKSTRLNSSH